jgi:hypothetical protein
VRRFEKVMTSWVIIINKANLLLIQYL